MAFSIAPSSSAGQECKIDGGVGDGEEMPVTSVGQLPRLRSTNAAAVCRPRHRGISDKADRADDVRLFS